MTVFKENAPAELFSSFLTTENAKQPHCSHSIQIGKLSFMLVCTNSPAGITSVFI
jgi:hypothetical protein